MEIIKIGKKLERLKIRLLNNIRVLCPVFKNRYLKTSATQLIDLNHSKSQSKSWPDSSSLDLVYYHNTMKEIQ